jgi:hypothetical protein
VFLLPVWLAAWVILSASAFAQAEPMDEMTPPPDEQDAVDEDAALGQEDNAVSADEEVALAGWDLSLFADERYRFRRATDPTENDHELRLFLDLGVTDPKDNLGIDVSLGLWLDLNGEPIHTGPALASMRDSSQDFWLDVYRLSIDYHTTNVLRLARVGRQPSERGKDLVFDGLAFIFSAVPKKLEVFVHGGRSVHFYELDQGVFEDFLASTGITYRPFSDLRFDLDYLFTWEDIPQTYTPETSVRKTDVAGHSVGFYGWYRYESWVQVKAGVRSLNDQVAEASADIRTEWQEQLFGADFRVKVQPSTLSEVAESFDPFFAVIGRSKPHARFSLDLWKGFDTVAGFYSLHAGYEGRQLLEGDEEAFNRNFGRLYLLFSAENIAQSGVFLTALGERWGDDLDLGANGLWALGGSAGWKNKIIEVGAGSLYQRYKYDYYQDVDERADVQTFFGEIKGTPLDWLRVYGRYEYEMADRDLHTLTVGMSQIF